jgi:hypothetical protein
MMDTLSCRACQPSRFLFRTIKFPASIILPAGGKFEGDIKRAMADGRGYQKNDAKCAPPVLIVKTCPDDGESDDDPDNAVRFADVAFHEIVLLGSLGIDPLPSFRRECGSFLFGRVQFRLILLSLPHSCK